MKYLYISIVWVLLFTFHCIQFKEHPLDPTTLQGQLLQNILKYFNSYVPTFILMYHSSGYYNGDIKSYVPSASTTRDAVDTICSDTLASLYPEYSYLNNKKGFISIDGADQISSMPYNFSVPTNVPILGPDPGNPNRLVANNWNDLWDEDDATTHYVIRNTLELAIGLTGDWWSGSDQYGNVSSYRCLSGSQGWTSTSGNGEKGIYASKNYDWIAYGTGNCNGTFPNYIICIAW